MVDKMKQANRRESKVEITLKIVDKAYVLCNVVLETYLGKADFTKIRSNSVFNELIYRINQKRVIKKPLIFIKIE